MKAERGNLRCLQAPRDPHAAACACFSSRDSPAAPCPPASLWGWSSPGVLGLRCPITSWSTLSPSDLKLGGRKMRGEIALWPGP